MYCIGLTGTIASGKSTVAQIFIELGATVISADKISREITSHDKTIINKISNKFGKNILDNEGHIERKKLRDIIFTNQESRIWLENLLHPLIRKEIEKKINKCSSKFCVVEIPLLKERAPFPYLDNVLLITTDLETQIQRLISRDNINRKQAMQIINAQPSIQEYKNISDTIIINNNNITDLQNKIRNLVKNWDSHK